MTHRKSLSLLFFPKRKKIRTDICPTHLHQDGDQSSEHDTILLLDEKEPTIGERAFFLEGPPCIVAGRPSTSIHDAVGK